MAYAVRRSTISPANANIIRSMLCLQPDTINSKYNRGNVPEPVLFYNVDGDIVHLPYLFAAALFNTTPNIDTPFPVTQLEFTGTLRENQISVELEAWEQLQRLGTSTLGLYPGFGKTILGARLASRAKLMTVVLVHREILTTQWKKSFEDFTNGKIWVVGEKYPPEICDVIICMNTRWHLIPQEMRDAVGFLIIDEAHAFCTPTNVGCLLSFHPKYILVESASLLRDDGMHSMIYAMCGDHGVFRESNNPFNVMKILTNTKPLRKKNRMGGVDWASLVQDTLMDQRRNQIILGLVTANINRKILILTSLREHAILIYNNLEQMGIPSDYLCGTKRGYVDSTVLVGTVSKIGTGFDPATSCPTYAGKPFDLLILACSMKKYSMLVQNIGRVFRAEFPTVMHLVDNDDIYKNHWYKARKWYMRHGGLISEHNIENTELPTLTTANITEGQQNWIQDKINKLVKSTQGLTLNITNPLNEIRTHLHPVQQTNQIVTQVPKVQPGVSSLSPILTMNIIPQIPVCNKSEQGPPLIFGRRLNNELEKSIESSPVLSVKTEIPTKLEIVPTMPVKTEKSIKLDIAPILSVKTERPTQLTIVPIESVKTEPRKQAIAITTDLPLMFARRTCNNTT